MFEVFPVMGSPEETSSVIHGLIARKRPQASGFRPITISSRRYWLLCGLDKLFLSRIGAVIFPKIPKVRSGALTLELNSCCVKKYRARRAAGCVTELFSLEREYDECDFV
jgi:hypothetical protein